MEKPNPGRNQVSVVQSEETPERLRTSEAVQAIGAAVLVGLAYYLGTMVGFALTPADSPISTLWPPNAILMSALLLAPRRRWALLVLAVLPAHLIVQLHTGVPVSTALGWFASNVSEALL